MKVSVGDWVRFYRNGVLVIGIVQYPADKDVIGTRHYATDAGEVNEDRIMEVRSESAKVRP